MAGRPTSLTPEVHKAIVANVRKGVWVETAAAAARVHKASVYNWIKWGSAEDAEEPYLSFALDVMQARAEKQIECIVALLSARAGIPGVANADVWTNLAWFLERTDPAAWSGKVRATVEETVEQAMRRLASVLDADSLEKARAALRPDTGASSADSTARH